MKMILKISATLLLVFLALAPIAKADLPTACSDMVESAGRLGLNLSDGLSKTDSDLLRMVRRLETASKRVELAVQENRSSSQIAEELKQTAGIYYEVVALTKDEPLSKQAKRALRNFEFAFEKAGEGFTYLALRR